MAKTKQVPKKEIKDETKNVETTETVEATETQEAPAKTTETVETVGTQEAPAETSEKDTDLLPMGKGLTDAFVNVVNAISDDFEKQLNEEAEKLMKQHDVDEIWRCPVTGYWFTKKENAAENAGKVKAEPEHYKL